MRQLIDRYKFCEVLSQELEAQGYNPKEFTETNISKIITNALVNTPIEDRYYSEDDMDYLAKIEMRLISKFHNELTSEYGDGLTDISTMMDTLYKEQNAITPLKWYEYCNCIE